ncbi:MAG: hypothetical protein ACTSW1_13325, partial [Candidatus Hodarchaeales archaeon]
DDSTLRIVSDDDFNKAQERLRRISRKRRKSREKDPIKSLVKKHGLPLLDFLDRNVKYVCDLCGGNLVKNGKRKIDETYRQNFKCKECGKQTWVPTQTQLKNIQKHIEEKNKTINPLKDLNPQKKDKKSQQKKERKKQNTNLDDFMN